MPVTREVFEQQCKRRFGTANPERMRLEHWEWMVRHRADPYSVRTDLGIEPNYPICSREAGCAAPDPDWCFERFGMSRTTMPDGRVVCIAGEHEDSYHPDFCIYNDVVVLRPAAGQEAVTPDSGEVEIYGYPESVFPPTDFHSATLVGDRIIVIGRLGYQGARLHGQTPVLAVDASTYRVEPVATAGPAPGWIYEHHASYDAARHAITVRGGKIELEGSNDAPANRAAHRLHLADMRWEVIANRETHRKFLLEKEDDHNRNFREPHADSFRPHRISHTWLLPEDRGVFVYGIDVQGVRVQFLECVTEVQVLIQGDLPHDVVDTLLADIAENLRRQTGSGWSARAVRGFAV